MGRLIKNRQANPLLRRQDDEKSFLSRFHRGRVTAVHIEKGTVHVSFETLPYDREVPIPVMGLSVPPKNSETDKNYLRSSWGRYIPQVGDVLMIGFDISGEAFVVGHDSFFYEVFTQYDEQNESRGGIGWGQFSGRPPLKPGDWDFRSSRASTLYLGDRAYLTSGPHSIVINKPTADITTTTTLAIGRLGEASIIRRGGARRQALPTDQQETDIYSSRGGVAQEMDVDVKYGGATPGGTTLARESLGDVIDNDLVAPMLGETGQTVRKLLQLLDATGNLEVFIQKIDTGGNQVTEAQTAEKFSWNTPLAAWDVTNLSTKIESSTSYEVSAATVKLSSSGTFDIEATGPLMAKSDATATVEAPAIYLGDGGSEPFVKGNVLYSLLSTVFNLLATHTHPTGMGPSSASVEISSALSNWLSTLEQTKSIVVKGK